MIIDVDIGNTRVKWRIAGTPDTFYFSSAGAFYDGLPQQWSVLPKGVRFRVGSVLGAEQTRQFCDRLARLAKAQVDIAVVKNSVGGISVGYTDVASLGVDRWLALLAARARYPGVDCVVLHAGTALVADFLRADGQHLGGYLVGGWQAALRALGEAAPGLAPAAASVNALRVDPGATTLECVEAGVSLLFRGFLDELARAAAAHLQAPSWLLAGGDAEKIQSLCAGLDAIDSPRRGAVHPPHIAPGLVLDGLAVALP